MSGEVDALDRARLELASDVGDLAELETVLTRCRRGLGNPEAQPAGFTGKGRFRGRWGGTLDWPVFEGRFEGDEIGYGGVEWGSARWAGSFDTAAEAVESHPLVAQKGGGEIEWNGRAEIGWFGARDALAGRARATAWPVEDLVRFMQWDLQATGRVSGSARVGGRRSAPEGDAQGTARDGRYYGIAYDEALLESRWKGRRAEVTRGAARLGGGRVDFAGSVTDDGVYDGSAEMKDVEIGLAAGRHGRHGPCLRPMAAAGHAQRARASWGRSSSSHLFYGDEGIGALAAPLHWRWRRPRDARRPLPLGPRRPRARRARCSSRRPTTRTSSSWRARPASTLSCAWSSRGCPREWRSSPRARPASRGRSRGPRSSRAEAVLSELELLTADFPVRAREGVTLKLAGGRLDLGQLSLAGEGTDLRVRGALDALGEGPLAIEASGRADLRVLAALTRRFRGQGDARLALSVSGSGAAPLVRGTLDLEGAGLRLRGFPHGVEGLRGRVRFSERAAELEEVRGTLAGGRSHARGPARLRRGAAQLYDIRPTGRGLALRYPEGLRSLLDAELSLFGDADQQWITGTIDVRQALYTRRYDIASELLALRRALPSPQAAAAGAAPGSTSAACAGHAAHRQQPRDARRARRARAAGHDRRSRRDRPRRDRARPRLLPGPHLRDPARRARLREPAGLDPLFDIEAFTRIRSYQVTLRVSGTLERVTPTLTSDPAAVVAADPGAARGARGERGGEPHADPGAPSQAQLAARAAPRRSPPAALGVDGPRARGGAAFGLNRFSIDPSLLRGAGTTPTARVTVGKRLTTDLNVLYSQDLRGTEERILAVEYTLTDRFSLLLTRTDPGTAKTGAEQRLGLRRADPAVPLMLALALAACARHPPPRRARQRVRVERDREPGSLPSWPGAGPAARPRGRAPLGRADLRDRALRGRARRARAPAGRRGRRRRVPAAAGAAVRRGAGRGRQRDLTRRGRARRPPPAGRAAVARAARARRARRGLALARSGKARGPGRGGGPARDPGGAHAVFRSMPGRARASRAHLECNDVAAAAALQPLVRPRTGEPYMKEKADEAREAMRKRLAETASGARGRARPDLRPARARMSSLFRPCAARA